MEDCTLPTSRDDSKLVSGKSTGEKALCVLWASVVGASVPLGMAITIFLNSKAEHAQRQYHAFYVSNLCIAMGAIELIPFSLKADKPVNKPMKWWYFLGGAFSLFTFPTIYAGSVLGTHVVLIVQLAAWLTTFFIVDVVEGNLRLTDYPQAASLMFILGGAVLANIDQGGLAAGHGMDTMVSVVLVALSGAGFAMQSKCNNGLAECLGSSPRATVVSAGVHLLCSIPLVLYLIFSLNVHLTLDIQSWHLWLVAGSQSAFYIGSMAYLPSVLGFSSCCVIALTAQLSASLFIDAKGFSGEAHPVTAFRLFAVGIVLMGSTAFNITKDAAQQAAAAACRETAGHAVFPENRVDPPERDVISKRHGCAPAYGGVENVGYARVMHS